VGSSTRTQRKVLSFSCYLSNWLPGAMKRMTPQEEKALLLRVVTKLAAPQLEQGGFIPFGAILGQNRDVRLL